MAAFFDEPEQLLDKAQRSASRKRKAKRIALSGFIVLILALIVALVGTVAVKHFMAATEEPEIADYSGAPSEEVVVAIPAGSTGADMGKILKDAGVVASAEAFVQAFDANPRAASIQPGAYYINTHISGKAAVAALLDPASKAEYTVTIPEGERASAIYEKLANVYSLTVAEVTEQAKDTAAIGLPAEAGGNLEGWLAPGQYNFMPDTTVPEALGEMVARRVEELEGTGIARDQWQRQLIIASIAEKEVRLPDDYPKVARVIENRLEQDMPLQVESTVMYALGKSEIVATKSDLQTESPYNLHVNKGLPPGPICNPNIEVVKATINPPEGDWLFWVTVNPDTGETKFAVTNEEHESYAVEFDQWLEANAQ